ncbi:hypothetical protein IQ07DRAFT_639064 [Pyrenochaeta sp. DS3sAY3a]|nr:hypothetical protein IQ07DRAFT_639064 [Pyrenochaeta sp. DS3sAY3a]
MADNIEDSDDGFWVPEEADSEELSDVGEIDDDDLFTSSTDDQIERARSGADQTALDIQAQIEREEREEGRRARDKRKAVMRQIHDEDADEDEGFGGDFTGHLAKARRHPAETSDALHMVQIRAEQEAADLEMAKALDRQTATAFDDLDTKAAQEAADLEMAKRLQSAWDNNEQEEVVENTAETQVPHGSSVTKAARRDSAGDVEAGPSSSAPRRGTAMARTYTEGHQKLEEQRETDAPTRRVRHVRFDSTLDTISEPAEKNSYDTNEDALVEENDDASDDDMEYQRSRMYSPLWAYKDRYIKDDKDTWEQPESPEVVNAEDPMINRLDSSHLLPSVVMRRFAIKTAHVDPNPDALSLKPTGNIPGLQVEPPSPPRPTSWRQSLREGKASHSLARIHTDFLLAADFVRDVNEMLDNLFGMTRDQAAAIMESFENDSHNTILGREVEFVETAFRSWEVILRDPSCTTESYRKESLRRYYGDDYDDYEKLLEHCEAEGSAESCPHQRAKEDDKETLELSKKFQWHQDVISKSKDLQHITTADAAPPKVPKKSKKRSVTFADQPKPDRETSALETTSAGVEETNISQDDAKVRELVAQRYRAMAREPLSYYLPAPPPKPPSTTPPLMPFMSSPRLINTKPDLNAMLQKTIAEAQPLPIMDQVRETANSLSSSAFHSRGARKTNKMPAAERRKKDERKLYISIKAPVWNLHTPPKGPNSGTQSGETRKWSVKLPMKMANEQSRARVFRGLNLEAKWVPKPGVKNITEAYYRKLSDVSMPPQSFYAKEVPSLHQEAATKPSDSTTKDSIDEAQTSKSDEAQPKREAAKRSIPNHPWNNPLPRPLSPEFLMDEETVEKEARRHAFRTRERHHVRESEGVFMKYAMESDRAQEQQRSKIRELKSKASDSHDEVESSPKPPAEDEGKVTEPSEPAVEVNEPQPADSDTLRPKPKSIPVPAGVDDNECAIISVSDSEMPDLYKMRRKPAGCPAPDKPEPQPHPKEDKKEKDLTPARPAPRPPLPLASPPQRGQRGTGKKAAHRQQPTGQKSQQAYHRLKDLFSRNSNDVSRSQRPAPCAPDLEQIPKVNPFAANINWLNFNKPKIEIVAPTGAKLDKQVKTFEAELVKAKAEEEEETMLDMADGTVMPQEVMFFGDMDCFEADTTEEAGSGEGDSSEAPAGEQQGSGGVEKVTDGGQRTTGITKRIDKGKGKKMD